MHQKPIQKKDNIILNEKVMVLEKVIHKMAQKVLTMEMTIEQLKKKNKVLNSLRNQQILMYMKSSLKINYLKQSAQKMLIKKLDEPKKGKDKKNLIKGTDSKVEFFNCSKCKHKCKNKLLLKNHMANKHEEHKCAECGKKVYYFI